MSLPILAERVRADLWPPSWLSENKHRNHPNSGFCQESWLDGWWVGCLPPFPIPWPNGTHWLFLFPTVLAPNYGCSLALVKSQPWLCFSLAPMVGAVLRRKDLANDAFRCPCDSLYHCFSAVLFLCNYLFN
jgi:hypothetical protein